MTEYLHQFKDWLVALGVDHHVDPLIFGVFYLTSKILFLCFLGWTVKNLRAKKPILLTLLFTGIAYSMPYVYLIIFGTDIPFWIYGFIILVFVYGAFTVWKKLTAKPGEPDGLE